MNNEGFRLSAILCGTLADIAISIVLGIVLGAVAGAMAAQSGASDAESIGRQVASTLTTPGWMAVFSALGLFGTLMGGFVAARMARHARTLHALSVGVVSLVLGLALGDFGGGALWFDVVSGCLVVPAAWLGSRLVSSADESHQLGLTPSEAS